MDDDSSLETLKEDERKAVDKRLENIGWALFLIMIGCLALVPGDLVPEGTWLLGTGLIMLGLNVARRMKGLAMSGFTLFLGTIAVLIGIGDMFGIDMPLIPILIILVGLNIIVGPMLRRDST